MAFGGIASQLIMFIAAVTLATGLVVAMKTQVDATASSMSLQQQRLSTSIKEEIKIEVIKYNYSGLITTLYAKNIGDTKIDIDKIDVFIDGLRIPRNDGNRTIEVQDDTDTINIGVWDRGEVVRIKVNQTLSQYATHTFAITTGNGITDDETYSYS